jgi:hypothetical protein
LEGAPGIPDDGGALQLDHRFLDVGVDASEHADEHFAAEEQGPGCHRLAMVVTFMERDHRVGHCG